jgi:hypothetical protein
MLSLSNPESVAHGRSGQAVSTRYNLFPRNVRVRP